MKLLLIVTLLMTSNNPAEIARINKLKSQAEEAYLNRDYQKALSNYIVLSDTLNIEDQAIELNKAHCYYQLKDTSNAKLTYQSVASVGNKNAKSVAYQQLGVIAKDGKKYEESLQFLKAAIKNNPTNEGARYDYELVKKLLQEQQQQNQDQQNQDQDQQDQNQEDQDQQNQDDQNQDQQSQDQQGEDQESEQEQNKEEQEQEGEQQQQEEGKEEEEEKQQEQQQQEEGDEKEEQDQQMSTQEKLQEMNISEEKAKMILEAMKNSEVQYLQQQKRKPTKRPDTGKPDW